MGLSPICLCGCGQEVGHCESLILYHKDLYIFVKHSKVTIFYSSLDTFINTNTSIKGIFTYVKFSRQWRNLPTTTTSLPFNSSFNLGNSAKSHGLDTTLLPFTKDKIFKWSNYDIINENIRDERKLYKKKNNRVY